MMSRNARGDTLVEVLLSIAIVGAVITGGYGLASHSLQEGISASEHTNALKMAESQVEALKYRFKTSDPATWQTYFVSNTAAIQNSCLKQSASPSDPLSDWIPQQNVGPSFNPDNLTALGPGPHYSPVCTDNPGNPTLAKYFVNITIPSGSPTPPAKPNYLITVRWNAEGGGPVNQEQLYYRF